MPAPQELATRARIRDAAIEQIARRGYQVSMRVIADAAGVSLGLINHHFGSKEGLKQACDDHVLATIAGAKSASLRGGALEAMANLSRIEEFVIPTAYCMRAIASGGASARRVIDHFTADAEQYVAEAVADGTLRPSVDERARIRLMTLQGFGALQLYFSLRAGPDEEFSPGELAELIDGYIREHGLALVELYTFGVFARPDIFEAYRANAHANDAENPAHRPADTEQERA
ncbi:transcriptional regulator RaaS [Zhihengliuella somnathii]